MLPTGLARRVRAIALLYGHFCQGAEHNTANSARWWAKFIWSWALGETPQGKTGTGWPLRMIIVSSNYWWRSDPASFPCIRTMMVKLQRAASVTWDEGSCISHLAGSHSLFDLKQNHPDHKQITPSSSSVQTNTEKSGASAYTSTSLCHQPGEIMKVWA